MSIVINVLRLSHRIVRDARMSTHLCLVARAFGADKVYYTGKKDALLEKSVSRTVSNWGGNFNVEHANDWEKIVKQHKQKRFTIVHLTMYGLAFHKIMNKVMQKNLLIIVGGEKVPSKIYKLSDYNVSIGSQPHSEVAALAVMLHMVTDSAEFKLKFKDAGISITPSSTSKLVTKTSKLVTKKTK